MTVGGDSTSLDITSEFTTWSEATETLEVTSEADRWRELRFRLEPVIIIARTTTPFLTGNRKIVTLNSGPWHVTWYS